ncbi:MAG: hypothetical protein M3N68_12145 [Actinomycetota bacterium]|nr:hypothetical protein [Actinomycetota bacterium]
MSGGGRPAPVRRHLRLPLWWAGLALVATGAFHLASVHGARTDGERAPRALPSEGTVEPGYAGGRQVPVRYHNTITGEQVDTTAYVWDARLLPEPGQRVRIRVDPDDPDDVALAGDRVSVTANVGSDAPLVVLPLAVWAARRWSLRRTERLIATPAPTFAMLGAIAPPRRLGRRCELHLYPMDATARTPSLCAVPLLTTTGAPIGGPAFPVEVKGSPRPLGRVVARVGQVVLWPSSRGLAAASIPLPPRVAQPVPLPPAPPPAQPLRPERWWPTARRPLLALVGALVLLAGVTLTTLGNGQRVERLLREGVPVMARVTAADENADAVEVSYRLPGEERARTARAPADFPGDYRVGRRYPARVDPRVPSRLRLSDHPYDRVQPLLWAALPVLVAGACTVRRRWWWQRSRRLARTGPWHGAEAWLLDQADGPVEVALGPPGAAQARCTVRLQGSGALEATSRQPVAVAGHPEPGAFVVVVGHRGLVAVRGPARASRSLLWSPRAALPLPWWPRQSG